MQIRARLNSRSHSEKERERERWRWWERGAGGIKDGKRRDKRRTGGETATVGEGDNEKGVKDEDGWRWRKRKMKRPDRSLSATCESRRAGLFAGTATAISHVSSAAEWTRLPWTFNGSGMTREGVLFSAGKFPNTLDKAGCCSSESLLLH